MDGAQWWRQMSARCSEGWKAGPCPQAAAVQQGDATLGGISFASSKGLEVGTTWLWMGGPPRGAYLARSCLFLAVRGYRVRVRAGGSQVIRRHSS